MSVKRDEALKFVSFIELTDDVNELLELLGQAESLNAQAEKERKLRRTELALIQDKLKAVRQQYKDIQVTDHAIVRYLERVIGLDIEACKQEMLKKLPKGYKHSDDIQAIKLDNSDLQYIIRDNLIVSVTPTEHERRRYSKREKNGESK